MFCTDAASARPEACRKVEGTAQRRCAGRSPGVQGRRRLAPCALPAP
ncbi:hypothetical protein J4730_02245 [Klebsiella pneumoniae]|uniref:Uncharacterized protein n=1 Tax=Klebsiella pneumoniae TaxID=573 RepID=A0A939STU3_KLEPN|nr:hypothetical protein [Klebsiella pneumoniae]